MMKIEPLFRGSIKSIDLTNGGVGYGHQRLLTSTDNQISSLKLVMERDNPNYQ